MLIGFFQIVLTCIVVICCVMLVVKIAAACRCYYKVVTCRRPGVSISAAFMLTNMMFNPQMYSDESRMWLETYWMNLTRATIFFVIALLTALLLKVTW
jgi:hypothetical protein